MAQELDAPVNSKTPSVSIIIPCRNERHYIQACVNSILAQEPPPGDFEVIIADAMSNDGTREIIQAVGDSRIRMIDNPERITPVGLNLAIRASRADTIIRMDAHADYPPNYIRQCLATLEETGADNVGGVWEIVPASSSPIAQTIAQIQGHWFGVGNSRFRLKTTQAGPVDTVPFGCFRRALFDRWGMFDERLVRNQDNELNARIRKRGGTVWLDPKIRCYYHPSPQWGDFLIKQFRNGQWVAYQSFMVSPDTLSLRHFAPLTFVLALMLGSVLSFVFPVVGLGLLSMVGLPYLLLNLWSTLTLIPAGPLWYGLIYPPLFLSNHLAYGLGSLWGVLSFPFRRKTLLRQSLPAVTRPPAESVQPR